MKNFFSVVLLLLASVSSFSQKMKAPPVQVKPVVATPTLSKSDLVKMKLLEDTLHSLSNSLVFDTLLAKRKESCYAFIPKLVAALRLDNSFYYPFDSLETISKVYPKDSSFRILTWQLVLPHGHFRYYGVIQMRSSKMKIFPLHDMRDTMQYQSQLITSNENWYGCLYYNIIEKQVNSKAVYTMFGYEAADALTRRKVIDIMTFDAKGKPKFGAPMFYFKYNDSSLIKLNDTLNRFFIEYKYTASTVLNYDRQMEMIVFDHVAPPSDRAKGATFTYVPDGTYEGFLWKNNHWNWVEKVFTFAINEDDNPPIPVPLFGPPKHQPELPKDGDPR
ncbi:MAG: hypothetical protein JWO06_2194 [Bacteroidota bacterium]|nr:hypothetical protein [Bacteroidota bacterium]